MKKAALAAALLAGFGAAQADKAAGNALPFGTDTQRVALPAAVQPLLSQVIDLSGMSTVGEFGAADNTVLSFAIGANAVVTAIDWNINLETVGSSWLSEAGLNIGDSANSAGVSFRPGAGDNDTGSASYSGSATLADYGLEFSVGADGMLRVELYEAYDDAAGIDANFLSGSSITVHFTSAVPEPQTYALMALGLAGIGAWTRRRQAR